MEILLATIKDLLYVLLDHPVYSVVGFFVGTIALLRLYCRLTLGVYESDLDLAGKTVLITGPTAGIGKSTAFDLARRRARVLLACRNLEKSRKVVDEIKAATGNTNVVLMHLNLNSFASVRKCAEEVHRTDEKLDILINNAGIIGKFPQLTEDGCEVTIQVNHLSHFLLTLLLLDLLKKSAPSRIINVASAAYVHGKLDVENLEAKQNVGPLSSYFNSKLANVLFTVELASRLAGTGITVNTLCPGMVMTDILWNANYIYATVLRFFMPAIAKTCEEGAQTTIYLAVDPSLEKVAGKYFVDCKEKNLASVGRNRAMAKRLFEVSEKITGVSLKQVINTREK